MPRYAHRVAPGDCVAALVTSGALTQRPRFTAIYSRNLVDTLYPVTRQLAGPHSHGPLSNHQELRVRMWSLEWQYSDDYPREGFYNLKPSVEFHDSSPISLDCNHTVCQMADSLHERGEIGNDFRSIRVSYCADEKMTLNFPDETQLPGQGFFVARQYWYIQRFARHL